MSDSLLRDVSEKYFKLRDIFIILLCLLGAAMGLFLFRQDLFRTINSREGKTSVGTITIKNNVVQRRLGDRVLWDRLFIESPVYLGDLIRVAELSSATLNVNDNHIDLNENTLIRIQQTLDSDGNIQVELAQGSVDFSIEDGKLTINMMGLKIKAGSGTILNASAGEEGMVLKINRGTANIIEEGSSSVRELSAGTMVALDSGGREYIQPDAVITQPRPNARYIKSGPEPVNVIFAWKRINLESKDALRLEISGSRNFLQTSKVIGNLDNEALAALDTGLWYWRLYNNNDVLSAGQLTVVDASGPFLISPKNNSTVPYQVNLLRFQWAEISEASYYILEAGETQDFINPKLLKQTSYTSYIDSSLGPGTWYWRVKPVFPPFYEGNADFSPYSSFRMEQGIESEVLPWPEPVLSSSSMASVPVPEISPAPEIRPAATPPRTTPSPAATPQAVPPPAVVPTPVTAVPPPAAPQAAVPPPAAPRAAVVIPPAASSSPANIPPPAVAFVPQTSPPAAAVAPETRPAEPQQVSAPPPEIQPSTLLPVPGNRLPYSGYRIGIEELKSNRSIEFKWSPVPEANGYIFTLYQETADGRRQIVHTSPENRTNWILNNISTLDRGTFIWHAEAVLIKQDGTFERRGRIEESLIFLDIPVPGQFSAWIE